MTSTDRLSPLDASFLYAEDGNSHTDVGMVLEFDGPAMSADQVADAIRGRLPLVPRYRQKVKLVPAAAALPVWVDDVDFAVERHILELAVQQPGDDEAFMDAIGQVMSTQLARDKPLWEVHVLTGVAGGRWALVVRMHHAMVDGITSTAIVGVLLTSSPEVPEPLDDGWSPAAEPTEWQLLSDAMSDSARAAADLARRAAAAALQPFAGWTPPAPVSAEHLDVLRPVGEAPLDSTLTGPVGVARRFARTRFPLADFRRVKSVLGGTVNDVVLTVTARAFRQLLLRRGELVLGRSIRTLVPVALKASAEGRGGNQIGGMAVELPLGEVSPVECLDRIRAQTEASKALSDAMPAPEQIDSPGFGLPALLTLGSRMAGTMPALTHTVTSNVPGPQTPLYLHGRRLEGLSACISLWTPLRIAVQVLSYAGTLSYAVVADRDSVPDLPAFVGGAEAGLADLLAAAEKSEA